MPDTDRKRLLTLAAKAAGIAIAPCTCRDPRWPFKLDAEKSGGKYGHWNPLVDDGDALRLALKLNMTTRYYMGNACAQIGVPGQPNAYVYETNHADPSAAARLAIVRAAAAIGEALP